MNHVFLYEIILFENTTKLQNFLLLQYIMNELVSQLKKQCNPQVCLLLIKIQGLRERYWQTIHSCSI